jgi:hypothetical protein
MGLAFLELQHCCGGPFDLEARHVISSWERLPTTPGDLAMIRYLKKHSDVFAEKSLLHVGIGNGQFFADLRDMLADYVGITISTPEIEHFREIFGTDEKATIILVNKYDPRMHTIIPGTFDIIADGLLKSFACRDAHFRALMRFYRKRLSPDGRIITTEKGLNWGWAGNTAVAFTPGADPNPLLAPARRLGVIGLQQLAAELRFTLDCEHIQDIEHRHALPPGLTIGVTDDTVWILTARD